jgi:hypothetical protein
MNAALPQSAAASLWAELAEPEISAHLRLMAEEVKPVENQHS